MKEKEKVDSLESAIDRLQNSSDENYRKRVDNWKEEIQIVEDEQELEGARRYFPKCNLEGERPMRIFG